MQALTRCHHMQPIAAAGQRTRQQQPPAPAAVAAVPWARPASAAARYGDSRPGAGGSRSSRLGVDEQVAESHAAIAGIQGQSEWGGASQPLIAPLLVHSCCLCKCWSRQAGQSTISWLNVALIVPQHVQIPLAAHCQSLFPIPRLQLLPSRTAWATPWPLPRLGARRLAVWLVAWTSWSSQTAAWCVSKWESKREEGYEGAGGLREEHR